VKQGSVFYIAGEGHNGFARRAAAWSSDRGVSLKGLPFFKSSRSIVLTDEASVEEMLAVVDEMVQEHGEPQMIVIDTLARAMGAADENSTKEMGAAIRAVDDIREAYDCTVLAVHHTGHGNKDRARGSSALLGAVDAEFMVDKWSGSDDPLAKIEVKFTKMKDAKLPDPMNFIHHEVELIGADLEPTQSVVLWPIDDGRPKGGGPRLTGHKKRFMDALDEAKDTGSNGAEVQKVRDTFYNSLVDTNQDTKRRTWNRAFQDVSDMELISSTETMVYDER
jgi:nucleotide-binding universal stress UspA family protein